MLHQDFETEEHPFSPFVPTGATLLILGSFPGKGANKEGDWYYSAKRNQFWKIMSGVYPNETLKTIEDKKKLFEKAGIGIADLFLKVQRKRAGNLDKDLIIIKDNQEAILEIMGNPQIKKIAFTSHFVERQFYSLFPEYENGVYLPSPSPIYQVLSIEQKIKIYAETLPGI